MCPLQCWQQHLINISAIVRGCHAGKIGAIKNPVAKIHNREKGLIFLLWLLVGGCRFAFALLQNVTSSLALAQRPGGVSAPAAGDFSLVYSIRKPGSQEIEFFMVSWLPYQPVLVVRVV